MDRNVHKCTVLAFLSFELCACILILVALLVCEVSPMIIE